MIQSACLYVVRALGSFRTTAAKPEEKRKTKERKKEKRRVQEATLRKFS